MNVRYVRVGNGVARVTSCPTCGREWEGSVRVPKRCVSCRSLARARAKAYTEQVGISDASPDIMCDALLVADTSREGVPRLEVSAPMTFDVR